MSAPTQARDADSYTMGQKEKIADALWESIKRELDDADIMVPSNYYPPSDFVRSLDGFLGEGQGCWFWIERLVKDIACSNGRKSDGNYFHVYDEFFEWLCKRWAGKIVGKTDHRESGSHSGIHVPWNGQTRRPGSHNSSR